MAGGLEDVSVLLIEDEPFTRMVLARMLSSLGTGTVYQAADGNGGLAMLADRQVDLVLCDVEMRPMDGLAFLAEVRTDPASVDLPVILMTNRSDETRQAEARRLGATALISKPVEIDSLRKMLAEAFSSQVQG